MQSVPHRAISVTKIRQISQFDTEENYMSIYKIFDSKVI